VPAWRLMHNAPGMAPGVREEIVTVGDRHVDIHVHVYGEGPPLVYFHPSGGLVWDPFLMDLARMRTIFAPLVPETEDDEVGDLWELVLLLEECLVALGLDGADLMGAGFGGMLACELQATFPGTFGRLVALSPLGLWREGAPPADWAGTVPSRLTELLFAVPDDATESTRVTKDGRDTTIGEVFADMSQTMRASSRYVLPDAVHGLQRRLHRIIAPTLVVWGELDAVVPAEQAEDFARRVPHARVVILPGCGHVPQVERHDETLALVQEALA